MSREVEAEAAIRRVLREHDNAEGLLVALDYVKAMAARNVVGRLDMERLEVHFPFRGHGDSHVLYCDCGWAARSPTSLDWWNHVAASLSTPRPAGGEE